MKRKTYFISDVHLGSKHYDDPREMERRVCRWLREIEPECKRLYLLGDILDYWFEYKSVVPRGFTRFLGTLGQLADSGTEVVWYTGNHDIWIFDYLPAEIGLRLEDKPREEIIDGKHFFLGHGDGLGPVPPGERLMRAVFRNPFLQWCFAGVHPRWTVGLAYGWSSKNRTKHTVTNPPITPLLEWIARNPMPQIDYYIFGHYHRPEDLLLPTQQRLLLLGDWFAHANCAIYDPTTATIELHPI